MATSSTGTTMSAAMAARRLAAVLGFGHGGARRSYMMHKQAASHDGEGTALVRMQRRGGAVAALEAEYVHVRAGARWKTTLTSGAPRAVTYRVRKSERLRFNGIDRAGQIAMV